MTDAEALERNLARSGWRVSRLVAAALAYPEGFERLVRGRRVRVAPEGPAHQWRAWLMPEAGDSKPPLLLATPTHALVERRQVHRRQRWEVHAVVPAEVHSYLLQAAMERGLPLARLVRELLREAVSRGDPTWYVPPRGAKCKKTSSNGGWW